eukprot:gene4893-59156_t
MWSYSVLAMDLCLVLQAAEAMSRGVAVVTVLWLAAVSAETAWGWGLFSPRFTGTTEDNYVTRLQYIDCARPPCPQGWAIGFG